MSFKKAVKKQVKLKIALTGVSGSGKTLAALNIAKGFGAKKIAVIDTENDSASLYADEFEFYTEDISAPYTTEKYLKAINDAVKGGYDFIIVDSASHAWAASGGLLEQKEQIDARGRGNGYTNWATITKKHEEFKAAILSCPVHMVITMRSKTEYAMVEKNGKQVPQKVGLAPVQRDGMEYEFTSVLDIAINHEAEASKDRTKLFDGKIFKISEETGKQLKAWLESGVKVESNPMEAQAAQPDSEMDPEDLGSFVCKVGQKHTGKKLKDFDIFELDSFVKNTKKWFSDEKKKPSADWVEFFEVAEAYLSSREVPEVNPNEELV
jgi:hypothetical protein